MFSLATAPTNSLIITNVVSLYADLHDVSSVHNMTLAVILIMKRNTIVFYIFSSLNSWNFFLSNYGEIYTLVSPHFRIFFSALFVT